MSFFFFIVLASTIHVASVSAQCNVGTYTCNQFNCYNTATQKYEYDEYTCNVSYNGFTGQCSAGAGSSFRTLKTIAHSNTNWNNSDAYLNCGSPIGCNQGFYGNNLPSCSGQEGGGGGGGSCPSGCNSNGPECNANSGNGTSCPVQWRNRECSDIPCSYRNDCGSCASCLEACSPTCTGGGCSGGGGGGPTPTPAPSCTLTCPGTSTDQSGFVNAGGISSGSSVNGGTDSYTIAAGITEGDVVFESINNFSCGIFDDGNGYQGPCPTPVGGTGGSVHGASTRRSSNPMIEKVSQFIRKKLPTESLGNVLGSSTLLAQNTPGGGSTGGGATGGASNTSGTSTWSYPVRYHIASGDQPKIYTATAMSSSGNITAGGSCSCSVVLGCPATRYDPNEAAGIIEGCDNQCDFSVDPDLAHNNNPLTFSIETPPGFGNITLDYDDGTNDFVRGIEDTTQMNHTYTNSGVYDVHLTCESNGGGTQRSCTRRMASYCTTTNIETLPTGTPTPTPTPGPWLKVQDASFHGRSFVTTYVPASATSYDTTDRGTCSATNPNPLACFNSGEAGAVSIQSSSAEFGTEISKKGWVRRDSTYALNTLLTPSSFIEYVKARKDYKTITSLAPDQIESNRIHIYTPETTVNISNNVIPDLIPDGSGVIIVIDGDLIIDMTTEQGQIFNPDQKAITFVITGTLQIAAATTEMNAIFVTNEVDFAYDYVGAAPTPLKITGNISVMNTPAELCNEHRTRTDSSKPVCLFQLDYPRQFVPLIDLLSTRTYDWTELVPSSTN